MQALSEWGLPGVQAVCAQASVVVIVDVLSFSTAVDIAVSRGAIVYPFPFDDSHGAQTAAARVGAILAGRRQEARSQFSLSPVSLTAITAGTKIMLPSPNGSRLSFAASHTPKPVTVIAGCLRNAAAVARTARVLADNRPVAVIPAGELWPDGSFRPAVEDFLGAGAILDALDYPCCPEAEIARGAFRAIGNRLDSLIRLSVSGRELMDAGYPGDVDLALEQNVSRTVPVLLEEAFRSAAP